MPFVDEDVSAPLVNGDAVPRRGEHLELIGAGVDNQGVHRGVLGAEVDGAATVDLTRRGASLHEAIDPVGGRDVLESIHLSELTYDVESDDWNRAGASTTGLPLSRVPHGIPR